MNHLFLFMLFFIIGSVSEILFSVCFSFIKTNSKVILNIKDFVHILFLFIIFQIFLTLLNYGEIRAFFTFSYIISILLTKKYVINPLVKKLNLLYNKVKGKEKCKKTEN